MTPARGCARMKVMDALDPTAASRADPAAPPIDPRTGMARMDARRQGMTGLALAAAIIGVWLANHVVLVWVLDPLAMPLVAAVLFAVQAWLSVGLFIVAHDAMHGSLVPFRPRANEALGSVALGLYAGFFWSELLRKHHEHHRYAGTERDPDFSSEHPTSAVLWYLGFMRAYMSWRLFGWITLLVVFYCLALEALHPQPWRWLHAFVFWLFPSLVGSMQLFYFGTYRPHRHEAHGAPGFQDRHNSRSNEYPTWLSLLTCFHFGYHHEHHLAPSVPWWRLPALRSSRAAAADPVTRAVAASGEPA